MNQKRFVFYPSFLIFFFLLGNYGVAQEQAIDLTKVDFNQSELHSISGQWEFYWNRFLTPEDFKQKNQGEGELMGVPGAWNKQSGHPALGFATYRVKIKLPRYASGLAIYFPVINSAAKIWINGEVVAETGNASANKKNYEAKLAGTVVEVSPDKDELEMIVQVANYTFFNGGFSGTPQIGKISCLLTKLNRAQGIDNFFAGSLIAMFIYQLVLYSLYLRGKPYLWLSLICLGVALRAMIVHGGSFLLPNLFPIVPWELWKKIEFGSVYAMTAFFALYIYHLFPKEALKWPIQIFVLFSSVLCLAVLVTPQYEYGQLLDVDHLALLFTFLYAIYTVGKAWNHGNKDAKIIFFGVLASFPFILTEILKNSLLYSFNIQVMYLVELGVLVFLLFQIYLLANHYAHSYKSLESTNQTLERMVVARTSELVAANRVRDRLLSMVTHDIKGPLNSLRGMLNIYTHGAIDADQFKHFSKRIDGDLSKTSLLVDNILYWTASQLKGAQVKFEVFDLKHLLKENIDLFQTIASNKRLHIKNEIIESHIINFDHNILNLTVRNLISNAIKFSHEGQEIIVRSELKGEASLVKIIDAGVGMSPEVLTSLQNTLTTKSEAGTRNEKGTGLGLSFCREYLQLAGGELEIESSPGKGTTLTISIPQKFPVRDRIFLNII